MILKDLSRDVMEQFKGGQGWTSEHTDYMVNYTKLLLQNRLEEEQQSRDYLSFSKMGQPCRRKLWYEVNQPELSSPMSAGTYAIFLHGDLLEGLVLALCKAAGYKVEGEQDKIEFMGITGSRDAVIEGVTVDVKSTTFGGSYKFRDNGLRQSDPFGYLSQLSSYVAGSKKDPLVTHKNIGAFIPVQKDRLFIWVDEYDLTNEINNKPTEIQRITNMLKGPIPQERINPIPLRKDSKNMMLSKACTYCDFKTHCWPDARVFDFSKPLGHTFLVDIFREPKVREVTELYYGQKLKDSD